MMNKLQHTFIRLLFIRIVILIFALSISACQAPKDKTSDWSSATGEVRPGPKTGKAVLALLNKARQASKKGSLNTAESHLERALRIEPRNPALWLYMAKLRFYADKPNEAINLAKKALNLSAAKKSMSKKNIRSLQSECWQVIAHAYQMLNNLHQAELAQEKSRMLSN